MTATLTVSMTESCAAATPEGHRELGCFKAIDRKTWNYPIIAHGRLVVRKGEEMACFDLTSVKTAAHSSE